MTNFERKQIIEEKERKIQELIDPTTFVLSKEVNKLYQEIFELQKDCPHDFENGVCQFCHYRKQE